MAEGPSETRPYDPERDPLAVGELRRRAERVLRGVLLSTAVMLVLAALLQWAFGYPLIEIVPVGAMALVAPLLLLELRRGRFESALYGTVITLIVGTTLHVLAYGSIRAVGSLGFVMAVTAGGFFLGRREILSAVAFASACIGLAIFAQASGWVAQPTYQVGLFHWIIYTLVLTAVGFNLHFGRRMLLETIARQQEELKRREHVEQALGEREDFLAKALRTSPAATVITNLQDSVVREANDAYLRLSGLKREELVGKPVSELGLWARESDRVEYVRRLRTDGRVANLPVRVRRPTGEFDALLSGEVVTIEGKPHAVSSLIDMTDLIETRAALASSEERFERLFHLSPIAMSLTRLDGRIVEINSAMERLMGYTRAEARGKTSLELGIWVDPKDRDVNLERLREGGRVDAFETRLVGRNGVSFDVSLSTEPIDFSGEHCFLAAIIDISEQKRAEAMLEKRVVQRTEELREANQELESFSYSVSHDLRAPLRAVSGYSALVLEEAGDRLDQPHRDMLERTIAASRRMGTLIDDLLGLSRVSRSRFDSKPVDLSALAAEVAAGIVELNPGSGAQISIQPGMNERCDRGLVKIALENLLGNAWKFTGAGPEARIRFGTDGTQDGLTVYRVSDNGPGFDSRFATKLFQPFQRLHSDSEFPGTGIGLATVARIVQRHGGRIWAESEPGRGATFRFTLAESPASP